MVTELLASTVVAAVVSGLVALLTAERRIAAENVIQERMKWRENVRRLVKEAIQRDTGEIQLAELRAELALRLNPHDPEDHAILSLIVPEHANRSEELTQRVSLLLKHDWERAKYESSLWRRLWEEPPERVAYEVYKLECQHDYRKRRLHCR
ncbi:hypothetical protein [Bradyrhizobium sp. SZCCHNR2032]|uniref:hypothetical protein n=1 Tax=Bradyrhizobium sp. SZCCHNR2032 TaxID=3057384 RepID=UPI002916241B|nr:hypothetical protein [Bradyrhizobium sp. SZCCHNR2032]